MPSACRLYQGNGEIVILIEGREAARLKNLIL